MYCEDVTPDSRDESMLVLDSVTGGYSERLTPSAGRQTLADFYATLPERGDHAVF
jgi:divinyl chlorophyllide a 8-vinyl-reductase